MSGRGVWIAGSYPSGGLIDGSLTTTVSFVVTRED